jgi:hypothetical protein
MNGRQNIEKLCPDVEPLIKRTEVMGLYKKRKAQSA